MGDGWETRRRRSPGYDWIIIKLGTATKINKIVVDTTFFKGNSPSFISLQAEKIDAKENVNVEPQAIYWPKILKKQIINPDSVHIFENDLYEFDKIVNYVKLNIYPDGGISRFRIFGKINDSRFQIHLIPETLKATNLDNLIFGDVVNLELDQTTIAIVDTTARILKNKT